MINVGLCTAKYRMLKDLAIRHAQASERVRSGGRAHGGRDEAVVQGEV
jgi:hypothetical protein